jgi:hypothetical protein
MRISSKARKKRCQRTALQRINSTVSAAIQERCLHVQKHAYAEH